MKQALLGGARKIVEESAVQISYALDTFYFLVMGALGMFMAPGFAMLEAGMVRAKNTSEILTKNVALFASPALCICSSDTTSCIRVHLAGFRDSILISD